MRIFFRKHIFMAYVYLLGEFTDDGEKCKIGVTRGKLENRIKKLQTGNPNEIYVVSYYETDYPFEVERRLHMRYSSLNVKNEWFNLPIQDRGMFKEICEGYDNVVRLVKENKVVD